jgi:hypothetical protein
VPLASIYSSTAARTPSISAGVAGFPDLILVRPPRLGVAELRVADGPANLPERGSVAGVRTIEVDERTRDR